MVVEQHCWFVKVRGKKILPYLRVSRIFETTSSVSMIHPLGPN